MLRLWAASPGGGIVAKLLLFLNPVEKMRVNLQWAQVRMSSEIAEQHAEANKLAAFELGLGDEEGVRDGKA